MANEHGGTRFLLKLLKPIGTALLTLAAMGILHLIWKRGQQLSERIPGPWLFLLGGIFATIIGAIFDWGLLILVGVLCMFGGLLKFSDQL